jgi:hypothetical protein
VYFFAVAFITDRWGVNKGEDGANLMPDISMASGTFELTIRDMFLVHED